MSRSIANFDDELLRRIQQKHHANEVKSTIEDKNLYNVIDILKNSLLHVAALSNNEVITKYLLASGSRIDAQNSLGQTPLMLATGNECEQTVDILINAGADIDLQDCFNSSSLRSVGGGKWTSDEILDIFLRKLRSDCSNDNEEIAKRLTDARWFLHKVVQLHEPALTKIMLRRHDYAAEIDTLDFDNQTALHVAVETVDVDNVKLLLEYNAKVNVLDKDERTPLWHVYDDDVDDHHNEKLSIFKMLLNRGAVLFNNGSDIERAYDTFEYGSREAIRLLLQANNEAFDRAIVMHAAAANKDPGAIEELHGKGFDLNVRNDCEQTPLITAARHGNAKTVEFLLDQGVDIDAVGHTNTSAIYSAIYSQPGCKQCVQILLECGADVQIEARDRNYSTVVEIIARNQKYSSLGELIVAHLALKEALGTPVTQLVRNQINSCDPLKSYLESSKRQLSTKIYESITLFDLLTVADEKLERYVCNEELISKIETAGDALSNHYYFSAILQKRLSKANEIITLKREAARIVSKIMRMSYESFPLVADNIVSYLDHEDMKNLLSVSF